MFEESRQHAQTLTGLSVKEGKMLTCPHCQGRGLRHLFNVFMGSFGKATCHLCGHEFGVTKRVKWSVQLVCYISGLFMLLLALTMHSAWPLIMYAAIILHLFILAMFRFDLIELKEGRNELSEKSFRMEEGSDKKRSGNG